MAQNYVEYHIQSGAFHTFKVKAGETVKIGQVVEVTGEREVAVAAADSQKAIGVVYSGSVGVDGINEGYKGDNDDVVTVVALKPLVYLEAGAAVSAGDLLKSGGDGVVVPMIETDAPAVKVGIALKNAQIGERFLVLLG